MHGAEHGIFYASFSFLPHYGMRMHHGCQFCRKKNGMSCFFFLRFYFPRRVPMNCFFRRHFCPMHFFRLNFFRIHFFRSCSFPRNFCRMNSLRRMIFRRNFFLLNFFLVCLNDQMSSFSPVTTYCFIKACFNFLNKFDFFSHFRHFLLILQMFRSVCFVNQNSLSTNSVIPGFVPPSIRFTFEFRP